MLDTRFSWQRMFELWCSGTWYRVNAPWRCRQQFSPKCHL